MCFNSQAGRYVFTSNRWYALEEKEHGVNQLRVVGGVCDCCLRVAMQFYDGSEKSSFSLSPQSSSSSNELESQSDVEVASMAVGGVGGVGAAGGGAADEKEEDSAALSLSTNYGNNTSKKTSLGIPMHPVPDIEIAELTKIIENAHRYLQIAFAEDLYLYSQGNNINFAELRDSLNTKWNVNILEPREGIGGHCLPKDTKMLIQSSSNSTKSKILTAAMEVDQDYRSYKQSKENKIEEVFGQLQQQQRQQQQQQEVQNPLPVSTI